MYGWSDYNLNIGIVVGFFYFMGWDWLRENMFCFWFYYMLMKINYFWFLLFDEVVEWFFMGCNYFFFKFIFVLVCLVVIIILVFCYDVFFMKNWFNIFLFDLFNLINYGGFVVFWWYIDFVVIYIYYFYVSGVWLVRFVKKFIDCKNWLLFYFGVEFLVLIRNV